MDCVCPKPTAITTIPALSCVVKFDQIQKIAFRRITSTAPFASETAFKTLSNWSAQLAATDNTKIQITPFFTDFVVPPAEQLEEGGNDNTTLNGLPVSLGSGFVKATGVLRGLTKEVANALKDYACESQAAYGSASLGIYLITRNKGIISYDTFRPIPIINFFISSVDLQGYNQDNKYNFSFVLDGEWDKNVIITKPNFDPLSEI